MMTELDFPTLYTERLRSFGIHLGAPRLFPDNPETNHLRIPEEPYVFWAQTVHCIEQPEMIERLRNTLNPEHITIPTGVVRVDESDVLSIVFRGVMVMLGHGIRVGEEENEWVFRGTRKPVSDTVLAFNEVARDIDPSWRPVDIVICCREHRMPSGNVSFSFNFRGGNAVCVYPFDGAEVKNSPIHASMTPGAGARIVAEASEWSALTWFRAQAIEANQFLLRGRRVPAWATTLVP